MHSGKEDIDRLDGFNYRLLKHESEHGDWHAIHEVFYNGDGKPILCSVEPINVQIPPNSSEPKESAEEVLRRISEATDKPIIDYKYFDNL